MTQLAITENHRPRSRCAETNLDSAGSHKLTKIPETPAEWAEEYLGAVQLAEACGRFLLAEGLLQNLDLLTKANSLSKIFFDRVETARGRVMAARELERTHGENCFITDHPFNARIEKVLSSKPNWNPAHE